VLALIASYRMNRLKLVDEEQVLKVLAERGRIHAIIEVRRLAGCHLRDAGRRHRHHDRTRDPNTLGVGPPDRPPRRRP